MESHRAQKSWSSSEDWWDSTSREKELERQLWFTAGRSCFRPRANFRHFYMETTSGEWNNEVKVKKSLLHLYFVIQPSGPPDDEKHHTCTLTAYILLCVSLSVLEWGGQELSLPWMCCFSSLRKKERWASKPSCTRWDWIDLTWCRRR